MEKIKNVSVATTNDEGKITKAVTDIIAKKTIISGIYYSNGGTYKVEVVGVTGYGPSVSFHGMASGCGLGLMGQWSTYIDYLNNKEVKPVFERLIETLSKQYGWAALIATVGDNALQGGNRTKHMDFIESLGFKEVDEFFNFRLHPVTHRQKIYLKKFEVKK